MAEAELAGLLQEAFESGNALAPLPASLVPLDTSQGEAVALQVLEALRMQPCGLRLAAAPVEGAPGATVIGPMLEGRLLSPARPVALAALRHAQATAAVVAVLAQPLPADADVDPVIAAFHPAIDIAAGRLREPHASTALLAADLGGLGLVVVGQRARHGAVFTGLPVTLCVQGRRPRPIIRDLREAVASAATAARRFGGLPAGAILVLAGLSSPITPAVGTRLSAGLGPLGRVTATFA